MAKIWLFLTFLNMWMRCITKFENLKLAQKNAFAEYFYFTQFQKKIDIPKCRYNPIQDEITLLVMFIKNEIFCQSMIKVGICENYIKSLENW
jgi:hypothetical protein